MSPDLHGVAAAVLRRGHAAARALGTSSGAARRDALADTARAVRKRAAEILALNDEEAAAAAGREDLSPKALARMRLAPERLDRIVDGVEWLAASPDPVGGVRDARPQPSGLTVGRMRVPLGLLVAVYESRPEVTLEAAALAVKSGNAIVLRGSAECARTNGLVAALVRERLEAGGLPPDAVQYLDEPSHEAVWALLESPVPVDLVIARGGDAFVAEVRRRCPYPVLASGAGNCHIYVDADAELEEATRITLNAKLSAPRMCNAVETVLVHRALAPAYLGELAGALLAAGVEVRGCAETQRAHPGVRPATEEDWATEYLGACVAVRVVGGVDEAIEHVNRYGTGHSEAILTSTLAHAQRFQRAVDAAAVYVNASTRFTYGYEFGIGPMLAISTQKLHARGPVGVEDLTSEKFVVTGSWNVRESP